MLGNAKGLGRSQTTDNLNFQSPAVVWTLREGVKRSGRTCSLFIGSAPFRSAKITASVTKTSHHINAHTFGHYYTTHTVSRDLNATSKKQLQLQHMQHPAGGCKKRTRGESMTTELLLQHCSPRDDPRIAAWPWLITSLEEELYGDFAELKKTAAFVKTTGSWIKNKETKVKQNAFLIRRNKTECKVSRESSSWKPQTAHKQTT